ncbi:MAG TPA: alpha/beta fold hydrolase [Usitatibacter sp.]|jgi:pimeloyl-ACP methyl ester carboxylesterase|nr:alpha/beta fold hydrolase [Usitatibacter sp.]
MNGSRRSFLAAGATLAAVPARASNEGAAAPAPSGRVVATEYWADKNGVKLWVYRKRLEATSAAPRLFLVHGSSYSGKTMFDLQVPGRDDYSMMDHFARLGYDVWTMDHEGYGHSQRTSGNSDIGSGVEDLAAAMKVVERQASGPARLAFFGQSSGALRAARFAQVHPGHVEKLALDAFVWTGKDAPTLAERRKNLPRYAASNRRPVSAEFYRSVFTRDHSGAAEPMLGDIVAREEMQYGDSVPTGTYVDMTTKLPLVDPDKVTCPVMISRAEHDGIATDEDIMAFYGRLPNPDKTLVKIGGLAHTALLGVNRGRFFHALQAFLSMPPRIDLKGGKGTGGGDA